MNFSEAVATEARKEFFKAFSKVISSIERHDFHRCKEDNGILQKDVSKKDFCDGVSKVCGSIHDEFISDVDDETRVRKYLSQSGNLITIYCSNDVYDLLFYLFKKGELLEIGFRALERLESCATPPTKTGEHYNPVKNRNLPTEHDIYMIRPIFLSSTQLRTALKHKRAAISRVVCLPEVCDMFPETLQRLLGPGFVVSTFRGEIAMVDTHCIVECIPCEIHMVPVENGVLSMAILDTFSDFYLHGDPTSAWFFAKAIEYLEKKFFGGAVPYISALGILARYSLQLLVTSRRESAADIVATVLDKSMYSDDNFISFDFKPMPAHNEKMLNTEQDSSDKKTILGNSPILECGIIIDRKIDLITPMCFNFTYEGLLDAVFGIKDGCISVDRSILEGKVTKAKDLVERFSLGFSKNNSPVCGNEKRVTLSGSLYNEVHWLNYNEVGNYLHSRALKVHKGYELGSGNAKGDELRTIGEMSEFVKKYKSLQQEHLVLAQHVNIVSWLNSLVNGNFFQLLQQLEDGILQGSVGNKLEDSKLANITAKLFANKSNDPCIAPLLDLIFWNVPVENFYRLLILLSQTCDGVKRSDLNTIKRAIMFQYGHNELIRMENMEKAGAIKVGASIDNVRWSKLCRKLNLLVDKDSGVSDYSRVFGGYAPVSLRIAQLIHISRDLVNSLQSEFSLLNCPVSFIKQSNMCPVKPLKSNSKNEKEDGIIMIAYLGGVTLGEIAAVSILNSKKKNYLILTTGVISYRDIIESFK